MTTCAGLTATSATAYHFGKRFKLKAPLYLYGRSNRLLNLPARNVPDVMIKMEITILIDGFCFRNRHSPSTKLAIGIHLLMALYMGIFIPVKADSARKANRKLLV